MSEVEILKAEKRTLSGTGGARALRRMHMVPCVVYGDNKAPDCVAILDKEIIRHSMNAGFYNKVFELTVEGGHGWQVLPKMIQYHPVTGMPLHVDFQRVNKNVAIRLHVPIEYINEDKAPAIKLGAVLNIVYHTVEILCPPLAIPEKFEIDLSGAQMGQNFTAGMLKLPEGCRFYHTIHEDSVLANIVQPQREDATEAAGADAADSTAATANAAAE